MRDATGTPQTLLLLGGTSDIALALAELYAARGLRHVWCAARPGPRRDAAVERLRKNGLAVSAVDFDAEDVDAHPDLVRRVAADADIDLVVVAFGTLVTGEHSWADHAAAVQQSRVNYLGGVSVGAALVPVLRAQGHGAVVVLSSVAGERVRRSNFVYGASKAGLDGFFAGLGQELAPYGVHVLVVRPGFVRSHMTEGLDAAPLASSPEEVARAIDRGLVRGRTLIWVPSTLRGVMSVLRHLPTPVFRRLPL